MSSVSTNAPAPRELVEDLPVDVHVVPDQVRMQRRHERGDRARPAAKGSVAPPRGRSVRCRRQQGSAPARRRATGGRSPSRARRGTSRRAAVCIRGRDARHEPVRPARDEHAREVVALLGERAEDVAALVREYRKPRDDRSCRRPEPPLPATMSGCGPLLVLPAARTLVCSAGCKPSHPRVLSRADSCAAIGALCVLGLLGFRSAEQEGTHGREHWTGTVRGRLVPRRATARRPRVGALRRASGAAAGRISASPP